MDGPTNWGPEPNGTWTPAGVTEWGGRPVARCVADAQPRRRAVLSGRLGAGRSWSVGLELVLDDGTGTICLLWLGRRPMAGLVPGATVTVEGTVLDRHGQRTIMNPLYEVSTS
jgi:hypothetical protein